MPMKTGSSRESNQDVRMVKHAAAQSPVIITGEGKPEFMPLSYTEHQSLTCNQRRNLVAALSMSGLSEIEFDPPKIPA